MSAYPTAYLFRHGEALNNVRLNTINGRSNDDPLVVTGVHQAERLAKILLEKRIIPDLAFSSPALRARQTGEITLKAMGVSLDLIEDERLHEQETGDWTGKVATDIFTDEMVAEIEAAGKDFRSPNGESMNDVGERVFDWLNKLEDTKDNIPQTVFAFTHGGPLRSLPSHILDWSHTETYAIKPANASATVAVKVDGVWEIEAVGVDALDLRAHND